MLWNRLNTAPGTKILLSNPEFFNGTLLLRQNGVRVLGGVVSEMYELWKAQEVMAMKNRYRSAIRNKDIHPPKFVSFEEYVKQKRRGDSKSSKQFTQSVQQPQPVKSSTSASTPASGSKTAGKQLDIKKVEDLDLQSIESKRKEVLGDLVSGNVKEMAKWGTTQQVSDYDAHKKNYE